MFLFSLGKTFVAAKKFAADYTKGQDAKASEESLLPPAESFLAEVQGNRNFDINVRTENLRKITVEGTFVNGDGWTYGVRFVWYSDDWGARSNTLGFKQWLINPEPYEHETFLTKEGAIVSTIKRDINYEEVLATVLRALGADDCADIIAGLVDIKLDDILVDIQGCDDQVRYKG